MRTVMHDTLWDRYPSPRLAGTSLAQTHTLHDWPYLTLAYLFLCFASEQSV